MDDRKATRLAILLAALLHFGLFGFLLLATVSCNTWSQFVGALGLPDSWNPVTCSKPLTLPGPVIEATLMGPTGAPPPPPAKHVSNHPAPPPPKVKPTVPKQRMKPSPVKTLPPPPKRPDVKNQEKVVAQARKKAEQAKHEQEERQKQHMAELQAQQQAKLDKLFKEMDKAKHASQQAERQSKLAAQRLQQLKDLKKSQHSTANAPKAANKAQSGTNGPDQGLRAQWLAAIQSAVTQAWLRPDNIPKHVVCPIRITMIPGGQVIDAHVAPNCPYDQVARRSVENAVMRAQPLPYHGFEKVFSRQITLNFQVNN